MEYNFIALTISGVALISYILIKFIIYMSFRNKAIKSFSKFKSHYKKIIKSNESFLYYIQRINNIDSNIYLDVFAVNRDLGSQLTSKFFNVICFHEIDSKLPMLIDSFKLDITPEHIRSEINQIKNLCKDCSFYNQELSYHLHQLKQLNKSFIFLVFSSVLSQPHYFHKG